ncbi:hypothetical protein HBI56_175510 [Parastagonospora nodorum]|uniref:Uncharacterized protein n=1 Tax=Phaeosphaeria nodorum (strain SN15 / ATCC MYA-4574 / FGSC 10173) TaxID=321614 RepID=A0A7U2FEP7_PHANO|nr:hypothetical protein HBH56_120970 [Parastagonospora nodorum]QRD03927.1 hypothetical protein JI435_137870 [Parastagonospora nodorum SN15]KAH3924338.1 hypothetical protein HBH54_196870 [Parastagonospora nodorum]KAH3961686.1 hypothetical protein HBH51_181810 [Parastagonospora nodorum]KAH4024720.1 hypothetical protein HBI09_157540 [Parastagonospora nodorum]
MKRKFSLAPVKIPSKDDTKAAPEPTPSHPQPKSQSHSKHSSKDSITDYSPHINRRVLDAHTERELRLACQHILQNFKPSDHGMENTDPKLDFGGLQRGRDSKTKDRNAHRSEPKVRLPTGAPVDLKTALEARGLKQTELTMRRSGDAPPVRANSSRKRADFDWLDERNDKREEKLRKSSSMRRKDRHADDTAAPTDTDADAAERTPRGKHDPQARPSTAVRSLSRSRSIRDNIKEYVFPGTTSRTISRAPSHGSLRTMNTTMSQDSAVDPPNSASGQGWRSWALPGRRSSSRSNSRPGTSKGQPEEVEPPKKTTVNLNRELPPLPSLDSWKDDVPAPEKAVRSPTSATHIASVMRPQDSATPERVAANKAHRRSGSDTLALQYNTALSARSPANSRHAGQSASRSKTLTPDSYTVTGQTLVASASTSNLGHIRYKSTDSLAMPKKSGEILNFSRKMSVDTPTRGTFSKEVKVAHKEEQKSRLKKVFTGWMTKKEKKDDWMQRIEKEGVKEGVMVQDGAASAPIVRY